MQAVDRHYGLPGEGGVKLTVVLVSGALGLLLTPAADWLADQVFAYGPGLLAAWLAIRTYRTCRRITARRQRRRDRARARHILRTNPPREQRQPGTDNDLLIDCHAIWPDRARRHDTTNQHRTGEK